LAEEQKNTQKGFDSCCQGKPFVDMAQMMGETKNAGAPFQCAEMMSRMMSMCCGFGEKKEAPQENPIPNP